MIINHALKYRLRFFPKESITCLCSEYLIETRRHILFEYSRYYYDSIILELIKERNLVLGLIQENSIENSVQDSLSYILITHGLYSTTLA